MHSFTRHRFVPEVFHRRGGQSRTSSMLPRLLAVALAALVALPIAGSTQTAEAGKKFKTITKTVSIGAPLSIPGAGTEGPADLYPATIDVSEFGTFKKARIKDVNLTLQNLNHTFPDNVDVMLVQGNRQATVMSDVGGSDDISNVTLTLDDQAGAALPDASALASGSFQPTNMIGFGEVGDTFPGAPPQNGGAALSVFNGANPDGQWQLFVHDDFNASVGSLAGGWSLEITAKVKNSKEKKQNKNSDGKGKKQHKHKKSEA